MVGWEEVPLESVCKIQSGSGFPKKYQGVPDGRFPFFKVSDMNTAGNEESLIATPNYISAETKKELGAKLFPPDSVVFPKVGGAIATNKKRSIVSPSCLDNNIMGLIPNKDKVDPRFLVHWINSVDIYEFSNKANPPSITQATVKAWPIPLPPLEEQRRIVVVLDKAFEGLDRARQNTETNLASAKELFGSVLGATGNSADWTSLTIDQMVDQKILSKPIDGNHGDIHPKKVDFVDKGVPFIMASDLKSGLVDQQSCYFITSEQASTLRKGFALNGDILLSHKGTIGRVAELKTGYEFVVLTPQVTYYRVTGRDRLRPRFLYYFFQGSSFQRAINKAAGSGATRAYIGITKQRELEIQFPDLQTQDDLVQVFDEIEAKCTKLEASYKRQSTNISELRQSILQRAFAGELT